MFNQNNKTVELKTKLTCHLESHVWNKMMGWCKAAKGEVSGMGLCKIEKGIFRVYEVYFPLQYGSTGYTELDDRALAKLQIGLYKKKIPADHFRFWWHTHYNFNVFWSGTDDDNATTLAKANGQWELSLVINQSGEFRCRADFFKKVHPLIDEPVHVLVDNIEVFTCPNSKRQRTKPHYKADVRRWVKPMSELPEKQKPKVMVCENPTVTPMTSHRSDADDWGYEWFGGSHYQSHQHRNYWEDEVDKKTPDSKFIDYKEPKENKKWSELKDGDNYHGFVYYQGFLISPADYEAKMADTAKSSFETCECGDDSCKNFEMCVYCDICTGRAQAATGYCPGCYDLYKIDHKGVKDEVSEPGASA